MAASNGRKTASSNKRTAQSRKKTSTQRKKTKAQAAQDSALFHEIGLIVLFAAMVFLFCCNFGIIGPIGDAVSGILFGLFGLAAMAQFFRICLWRRICRKAYKYVVDICSQDEIINDKSGQR